MSRRRRRPGTAVAKRPAVTGDVLRYDPTFDAWASAYQQVMGFGGLNYPLTGFTQTGTRVEPVAENYLGFAQSFYRSNGIVFAVSMARARLFTEARPCFRNLRTRERFTSTALAPLENPWPGGTIRDLLMRMEQDVTCGGNAFVVKGDDGERLRRYRPDWVELILSAPPDQAVAADVIGIKYTAGGPQTGGESQLHLIDDVCFWSPIPDPLAAYRGMSWLTPIIREVQSDTAATQHKQAFFENAATPNLAVSLKETVTIEQFKEFKAAMDASHAGARNAYKTLYLGGGADVKVVGADLRQLEFKATQGAGETRIAAAGGVPPIVAGLSEGLQNATYSNYGQARRAFGDHWARPQWGSAFAALAPLIDAPADAELWYDDREVAFLREDLKDMAEIQATEATTIGGLIAAGYEPDSIVLAVVAKDWSLLVHTGLYSVQLQPPGAIEAPGGTPAIEAAPADDDNVRYSGRMDSIDRHGSHNQKSHGNRLGRPENVAGKTGLGKATAALADRPEQGPERAPDKPEYGKFPARLAGFADTIEAGGNKVNLTEFNKFSGYPKAHFDALTEADQGRVVKALEAQMSHGSPDVQRRVAAQLKTFTGKDYAVAPPALAEHIQNAVDLLEGRRRHTMLPDTMVYGQLSDSQVEKYLTPGQRQAMTVRLTELLSGLSADAPDRKGVERVLAALRKLEGKT